MNNSLIPETALTIAGLTDYIRMLLEQDDLLRQVWVTGEVSSTNQHKSGLFFNLQDPDGKAAISCVVWNSQLPKLAQMPQIGSQIILLGSIRLYPQRGQYQIQVWQALPAGVGLMAMRSQQLRSQLEKEGLFAPERKKSLPVHPQTIAVVTSNQAAAWGDIQKTLKRRYPGLHVLFSGAVVQGETAPASIVKAIDRVEKDGRAQVLILSRGGGAVEDLACFNDERVVRAVANCRIPVITGIGHQRDESLTDLAADACLHTPTAAAEYVVPALSDLVTEHQERSAALSAIVSAKLVASQNNLQIIRNRLRSLRLDRQLQQEKEQLNWRRQQLIQNTQQQIQQATGNLELLRQSLTDLNPSSVLQRGYAVVRLESGAIARTATDLTVGQELTVQLGEGEIKVNVTAI